MQEDLFRQSIANPQNMGEMADADAVGTVGSAECGDMVRMWLKFTEKDGRRVIDRASFQSFGCQTAIAVASMATQLLKGKSLDEARALNADTLAAPLGALPPMKIHCGQMVEGALKAALDAEHGTPAAVEPTAIGSALGQRSATLSDHFAQPEKGTIKVIKIS